ncbi:hypothetical protein Droror1_Dr00004497 [Drosera rotundifolia]
MVGTGNGKFLKWKISVYRTTKRESPDRADRVNRTQHSARPPPTEFLCPVCESLMTDPVVVSSGHTFDRLCVEVCRDLGFLPRLPDGSVPDFSNIISNLSFKSTIDTWRRNNSAAAGPNTTPMDYEAVERIVKKMMKEKEKVGVSVRELIAAVAEKPDRNISHADTELTHRVNRFHSSSSSDDSSTVAGISAPPTPLPFTTRPACLSPSTSSISDIESAIPNPNPSLGGEDEVIVARLTSNDIYEQEQAVKQLRKITRSDESSRISLCTARLLAALRPLLTSRYSCLQTNTAAAIVNLSLSRSNKVPILRSGLVPPLIDLLAAGSPESQEHAAGALFSLSIHDDNKTAIGVLGALQPLLHALRSESERTRHDAALALYHLSHVQSNKVKLVRLGAVPLLLGMVRHGKAMTAARAVLVVWNVASCGEGRAALLDCDAVEVLLGVLRGGGEGIDEAMRENCVAALYALSHGSLRFRGMARAAGAAEVLREVVESGGSERAREKARRILVMLKEDGGELGPSRGGRIGGGAANSTEF